MSSDLNSLDNIPKTLKKIITYKHLAKPDDYNNEFLNNELPVLIKNWKLNKSKNEEGPSNNIVTNNLKNIVNNNDCHENNIVYKNSNNINTYNVNNKNCKKSKKVNKFEDQKYKSNSEIKLVIL